ncbi:toxin co-regulated pilus biosynthesis Q family protein [Actimicrobium sp. CCI2.3]|nr:toxin co-regulated pilus biosynthesis Q family protein [Actimicrobium sp. CCI2.3]MEB0023868.1 toxin co-regulated pilus biosynthesis Q family protein [Actimicrobium sp. CCI2.3]
MWSICALVASFAAGAPVGSAQAAAENAGEPTVMLALANSLSDFARVPTTAGQVAASVAADPLPAQAVNLRAERALSLSSLASLSASASGSDQLLALARMDDGLAYPQASLFAQAQPVKGAAEPQKQARQESFTESCAAGPARVGGVLSASQVLESVRGNKPVSETVSQDGQSTWVVDPRDGTLSQTLGRWAKDAHWQMNWDADRDFVIDTSLAMSGTLREAIELVMLSLAHTDYPLQAAMNSSTCTLRVSRFMDNQPR